MDQTRLESIRRLAQSATPDPRVGTDANEVFFRTDAAHYKADVHLVREARSIILDLLDALDAVGEQRDPSAHAVYCATVRQVTRLEDELARAQWVAAEFMDG